LSQP
jgi:hypothetical protein